MSAPHIHPEDLLDRARHGVLGTAEQRLLQTHLACCPACRFELSLAPALFAHVPFEPGDGALVARAMAKVTPVRRLADRKVRRATVLIAAAVAVASAVAAGAYASQRNVAGRSETPEPMLDEGHTAQAGATSLAVTDPDRETAPPYPLDPAAAALETAPDLPATLEGPGTFDTPTSAGATGCADWFRRANEARRWGTAEQAVALYQELRLLCEGTGEEVSSRVFVGRVYLDRLSDPVRALLAFESYLVAAPNGVLREDALIGRALALGRLNRPSAERSAWHALLISYPDSMYAEKARAWLDSSRLDRPR